jgi:rubrerythrin
VCEAEVQADGAAYVQCALPGQCGAGRRPRGLRRADVAANSGAAAWLARAAHLEAASVRAFAALATEIAAHGAPATLVRRARAAARDEARHARVVGALARRRGASIPAVRVRRGAPRSKVALAIENAVEGCVAETFAALVAHHQAENARDPEVRRAMVRIADDEAGHAALAMAIEAWLAPQLTGAEQRRVARAKARAAQRLTGWTVDSDAAAELGLPGEREGRRLARALGGALGWEEGRKGARKSV